MSDNDIVKTEETKVEKKKFTAIIAMAVIQDDKIEFVRDLDKLSCIDLNRDYLQLRQNNILLKVPGTMYIEDTLDDIINSIRTHSEKLIESAKEFYKDKEIK